MNLRNTLPVIMFIASLALSILFFVYRDFFLATKSLGLLGIFLINLVSSASFFVSGPAFLTVVAGGALYQPLQVALAGSFGATIGDSLGYVFGFSTRKLWIEKHAKDKWYKLIHTYFNRYGGWILFFFAFIPNPLFDSIGIIAGVFKYSLGKFLVIVFLGRLLRYYMLARFGALF